MSVSVRQLSKRFPAGKTPAVDAVSFDAPAGVITALLGPSGSGKSTLLRLVAGLETPDAGSIFFYDKDQTHVAVQERGVGMVFQNYALFRHLTVQQNVAFGLEVRRIPKAEIDARVQELLSLVQLEDFAHRYPDQLSGGQRQRVAFARALAIRPKILLLDEPFGALDARVRMDLREWLLRIHEHTHLTTLLVTHDQEEAMELSQHVVVLHEGKVVQAGSPRTIYDAPATPFVAEFVGHANVFSGTVQDGRAKLTPSLSVAVTEETQEGATVRAFVRAHHVRLHKAERSLERVAEGVLARVVHLGARVKVSLEVEQSAPITVELSRAEFDALGCVVGDRVLVDLSSATLFQEDYAI